MAESIEVNLPGQAACANPALAAGGPVSNGGVSNGDKALVILQSLLCLLREKNVLTRADIEELNARVAARAADCARDPFACRDAAGAAAAGEMHAITDYIGRRYGGKHRRG